MKRKQQTLTKTNEIADLKNINGAIEKLPLEKLMYVAGAVAALSAATNHSAPKDPPDQDSA